MPNVFATNKTSSSLTVSSWTVYYIDSTDAEIVEVEDGNNVKYNAFKYLLSGTPYWYVLDGTHDTWTDDLSEWGYSEVQPVVVLPTVETSGFDRWITATSNNTSYAFSPNTSTFAYVNQHIMPYDATMSYAVVEWRDAYNYFAGRVEFQIGSDNGSTTITNVSTSTLTFFQARIARCLSNEATVVTVYNSNNAAYHAFKYLSYYYVLDGTQTDWTDDLSEWGYSEVPVGPVLPEVDNSFYDAWYGWLNAGSNRTATQTIASNGVSTNWYYSDGHGNYSAFSEPYDSSRTYAIMRWNSANGVLGAYVGLSIVNESGSYGVKNITSEQITVNAARVAVCSDSTTTVVTVYNSSNVAYNAFKYTASGTDYYYVLDGTQTDWTDDLPSIGYSLYLTAYMNANGTPEYSYGGQYALYDHSGSLMPSDDTKTYTEIRTYTSSSDTVGQSGAINWLRSMSGKLKAYCNTGFTIQRIEYTVS